MRIPLKHRLGVRWKTTFIPVNYYTLFAATFPDGPPPKSPFEINPRALRDEYIHLQAINHPDRANPPQRIAAERKSAVINEAYHKLLDTYDRALHILLINGIEIKEEVVEAEGDLLMRVMEVREALEEAQSQEEVALIQKENEERVRRAEDAIADAFAVEDYTKARNLVPELRYWLNIRIALKDWEPGMGPILHH